MYRLQTGSYPNLDQSCEVGFSKVIPFVLIVLHRCLHNRAQRPLRGPVGLRDTPSVAEMSDGGFCAAMVLVARSTLVGSEQTYSDYVKNARSDRRRISNLPAFGMCQEQVLEISSLHLPGQAFWKNRNKQNSLGSLVIGDPTTD